MQKQELKELKMTRKDKKEVIRESLNNLNYLEVRQILIKLLDSNNTNKNVAYDYLIENHEQTLIDALYSEEILKEE